MTTGRYTVEVTETAGAGLRGLDPTDHAEVLQALIRLESAPLPGSVGSRIVRLRSNAAGSPPLYFSLQEHTGILFTVEEDLVSVLVIERLPALE